MKYASLPRSKNQVNNLRPLRLGKDQKDKFFKFRRAKNIIKGLIPLVLVTGILISLAIFLITLSIILPSSSPFPFEIIIFSTFPLLLVDDKDYR